MLLFHTSLSWSSHVWITDTVLDSCTAVLNFTCANHTSNVDLIIQKLLCRSIITHPEYMLYLSKSFALYLKLQRKVAAFVQ